LDEITEIYWRITMIKGRGQAGTGGG
jgi:hypothetical protein